MAALQDSLVAAEPRTLVAKTIIFRRRVQGATQPDPDPRARLRSQRAVLPVPTRSISRRETGECGLEIRFCHRDARHRPLTREKCSRRSIRSLRTPPASGTDLSLSQRHGDRARTFARAPIGDVSLSTRPRAVAFLHQRDMNRDAVSFDGKFLVLPDSRKLLMRGGEIALDYPARKRCPRALKKIPSMPPCSLAMFCLTLMPLVQHKLALGLPRSHLS